MGEYSDFPDSDPLYVCEDCGAVGPGDNFEFCAEESIVPLGMDAYLKALSVAEERGRRSHPTEQCVDALKLAYRKLHLQDDTIGSGEVASALLCAICEAIGGEEVDRWLTGLEDGDD